jgi:hypothetical protein
MAFINASLFAQPNLQLRIWFNDGVDGSTALNPPQNLTFAPYAAQALNAYNASNLLGNVSSSQLSGTLNLSQLPNAVVTNNANGITLNGIFSGDGSGLHDTTTSENYVGANSSATQIVSAANTFQTIPFSAASSSGWLVSPSAGTFTCNQSGMYLVQYSAEVQTTASSATAISIRIIANGNEYPNSETSTTIATAGQPSMLSKSLLITLAAGDVLQFQFAGSNTSAELVSADPNSLTYAYPNFSVTVIRIQ